MELPASATAQRVLAAAFALAKRGPRYRCKRDSVEDLLRQGTPIAETNAATRDFGLAMRPFEAQNLRGLAISSQHPQGARDADHAVPTPLGDISVDAGRKPVACDTVAALFALQIATGPNLSRDQIVGRLVTERSAFPQTLW